ncbi:YybH family protein [Kribbella lupini]|uniref:SnoaL-like domain-containing protein n=1 Tax=Kribbella lupini TaxID=291602 RepID=A0ABN2A0N5_9ACTN
MTTPHEAAITAQINQIIHGLRTKDLDHLAQLYTPDVVSFDIDPPLQHVGRAAKLKNWERVFAVFQDVNYELRDLKITAGDEIAFAHGFGRLSNGTTAGSWVRVTFCFRNVDGTWLIAHDQVSVPSDMAAGRAITDLEP